jgi:acetolactate synthase-1/2/3 large subunit
MWAAQYSDFREPRLWPATRAAWARWLACRPPSARQFAQRNRLVIDIDGDASMRMNLGELETVTTYDLPV